MLRTLTVLALLLSLSAGCGFRCRRPVPGHYVPVVPLRQTNALTTAQDSQPAPHTVSTTPVAASEQPARKPEGVTAEEVTTAVTRINQLLDAYFDFNAYHLRPDAVEAVAKSAAILKSHMTSDSAIRLVVEGHCDDRGSAEFNLALGDRRAESVREVLAQLGLPAGRITTISYGEARPDCTDASESCWQKNRRAHIRHER
jgi:peptidoglycan-associated lipoprotein